MEEKNCLPHDKGANTEEEEGTGVPLFLSRT
jgi:hypothetical protein